MKTAMPAVFLLVSDYLSPSFTAYLIYCRGTDRWRDGGRDRRRDRGRDREGIREGIEGGIDGRIGEEFIAESFANNPISMIDCYIKWRRILTHCCSCAWPQLV